MEERDYGSDVPDVPPTLVDQVIVEVEELPAQMENDPRRPTTQVLWVRTDVCFYDVGSTWMRRGGRLRKSAE